MGGHVSLASNYAGGASALGTASALQAHGLYRWSQGFPPYPNLTEPGHWVFAGWSYTVPTSPTNVPYMEFSFTASQAVSFNTLSYTFFSGNWSDIWIGPSVLQIWTSKDGFATSSLLVQHSLVITKPFTGAEVTYNDDFSSVGNLVTGETLSVRLVAAYHSQPHAEAPAGPLWAVSGPQTNLVLGVNAIPEPSTYAALAGGLGLIIACFRRRRRHRAEETPARTSATPPAPL